VKMWEALDLAYDLGRWQVLCKAPFLNTNDSRVAARLADGQWAWYYRTALRTVIQACGRVVRAPDDHGATYIADSSILDLFDRARTDMPPWFENQVDAMTTPDLPDPDPAAALAESSGGVDQVEPTYSSESSSSTSTGGQHTASDDRDDGKRGSGSGSPVADVWDAE